MLHFSLFLIDSLGTLPPLSLIAAVTTDPPLTGSQSWPITVPSASSSLSASLLAAPLPTIPAAASQAPALLLSPSLPPVPGKLVTKIKAGGFIHLKEFLGDNIALRQRLEESQPAAMAPWMSTHHSLPQMRNISTPLQWVYCMLTYITVLCPDEATRDRLIYAKLVLHLAQKHGGQGWLVYDDTFRAQAASDPSVKWNAINPSLMASAVINSASTGTYCHHCQEVDHRPQDCALLAVDPALDSSTRARDRRPHPQLGAIRTRPVYRPNPYDTTIEVCRRFNRGQCSETTSCKFRHICSVAECKKPGHGAHNCPMRTESHRLQDPPAVPGIFTGQKPMP